MSRSIFILVLTVTAILTSAAFADEPHNPAQSSLPFRTERPNTILVEAFGRSRLSNLSYERSLYSKFSVGAGLGFTKVYTNTIYSSGLSNSYRSGTTEVLLIYGTYHFSDAPSALFVTLGAGLNFGFNDQLFHLGAGYDWQFSQLLRLRAALYVVANELFPGLGLGFSF